MQKLWAFAAGNSGAALNAPSHGHRRNGSPATPEETTMTRKIAIAALAAALAAGPMLASEAETKNGRRTAFAIGAIAGIGGAIIGSAIANAQPRHHGYGGQGHGFRPAGYAADRYTDDAECFRKPIKRFDRYTGEVIVVGTKLVCH
jgi:hypothetical protein